MKRILFFGLMLGVFLGIASAANSWDWKGLHEKASKTDLKSALAKAQSAPDSPEDNYILGLVYLGLHKESQAQRCFEKVLSLDPAAAGGKWGLAEIIRRRHGTQEAESRLRKVTAEEPDFIPAFISLAYCEYTKMDFEASYRTAYSVLKRGRNNVDLSNYTRAYLIYAGSKGMVAHYGGPISKAINGTAVYPNLKNAQALEPDSPQVFFGLGSFYLLAPSIVGGDLKKAEEYLDKAIKADPLLADAYVRRAQLYRLQGRRDQYESFLQKALNIDPQNELALDSQSGRCRFICPQ